MNWVALLLAAAVPALGQTYVTTAQYNNQRTGANLSETILTPRNVNAASFGKLFAVPVDGDVYAQPLYVPQVAIPGQGIHNVVIVATEHDSVYAIDAAGQPSNPLWHVNFLDAARGINAIAAQQVRCNFIAPEVGITPTPVIDLSTQTVYVLARTAERDSGGQDRFYQRLHALNLATGAERAGSPVLIRAAVSAPAWFGFSQRSISFNALLENPRAALLLANGNVYIAWGSSCDVGPYYGWVLSYDARTLKQTGVFNVAPDAGESGIWQSDAGIAADAENNIYAVTGNGKFTASLRDGRDYGDSVLKLGFDKGALVLRDYFTPFNEARLNGKDDDLGSSGPVVLPDQPGAHPHLLVTAGKAGVLYLIDRDRMGKFHAGSDSHAVQSLELPGTTAFGAPAFWNGHLYCFHGSDVLKDFPLSAGRLARTPVHLGTYRFKDPGAIPSVSANGTKDGIVWAVITKGWRDGETYAILQAYDAIDVSRQLYSTSRKMDRDGPGLALRFTMPTVANGRVYVGTRRALYVYGLIAGKLAPQGLKR